MSIRKTLRELEEEEGGGLRSGKEQKPDYQAQLATLVVTATELIAKLNVEYGKFFAGAEKTPPVKQREELEKLIAQINNLKKHATVQGLNFKIQTVLNSFISYKGAWDKRLMDCEKTSRKR